MSAYSGESLSKSMEAVLSQSLPDSLNQLAQRNESFGQVVQYLEDNYIASQRSGKDKLAIEDEAKRFVTKGLVSVLKDIEVASLNIDQLLQMQTMAVDSLTADVSLIKSRLHGMKSQQLTSSLHEMKAPYATKPASQYAAPVRRVEVDYPTAAASSNKETSAKNAQGDENNAGTAGNADSSTAGADEGTPAARRKLTIEERLATLEGVGLTR